MSTEILVKSRPEFQCDHAELSSNKIILSLKQFRIINLILLFIFISNDEMLMWCAGEVARRDNKNRFINVS